MATGQVLIDADGKVLIDGDGKVKLWSPAGSSGDVAPYQFGTYHSYDMDEWNESYWDARGALIAAEWSLSQSASGSWKVIRCIWNMDDTFTTRLIYSPRYDVSAYDGETLYLGMRGIVSENIGRLDTGWVDISDQVDLRFVYQLSNVAQNSFALTTHEHRDLPTFHTMTIQDIRDYDGDRFAIALPDTTGYDFLYVGIEFDW